MRAVSFFVDILNSLLFGLKFIARQKICLFNWKLEEIVDDVFYFRPNKTEQCNNNICACMRVDRVFLLLLSLKIFISQRFTNNLSTQCGKLYALSSDSFDCGHFSASWFLFNIISISICYILIYYIYLTV